MKKITFTTLTLLLVSFHSFSQRQKETGGIPSGNNAINQVSNSRLILLSPSNGIQFNGTDGVKPILFRWSAIVPKPKEAVTYRLKVWQLMEGQNGIEAMRSNQPIVTKEVINITQVAISNLYTGPCKPPYLCDFIWMVEVLNNEDAAVARNYGTSDAYSFKYLGGIGTVTGSGGATVDAKSIQTNSSQGDPIHGVDVKLGSKSIQTNSNQGDPVHGVDVKPGLKSSGKKSDPKKTGGNPKSTNKASYDLKADKRV